MKKWGYYFLNDGSTQRISAKQVLYKDDIEGGWRGKAYYPCKNGSGGEMHAKKSSSGTPFFAFNNKHDGDEWDRKGGGESQTHYLFKMALLELESTILKFKGNTLPDAKVTIKSATDEKAIGPYFIDVYCIFESDNQLDIKWGGKLGIELCLTNPVEPEKKKFLMKKNIPVVQHKISKWMLYKGPEDEEAPEKERQYIEYVKRKIKENFIEVSLISNPSSELFQLISENARLLEENKSQNQKIRALKQAVDVTNDKVAYISQQLSSKEDKLVLANKQLTGAFRNIDELENTIKSYKFTEWVYAIVFLFSLGVAAFGYLMGILVLNI